jgi:N-acetylmuramoyl-L-alanine amidase
LTPCSTATNGDDDFDFVTVCERARVKRAARHDLAIALHGDAFARKTERRHQAGAR